MSGQRYYQDGEKPYEGGFGKFYYNKTQGSGNLNPQDVNWMSNINLSRTDRTKTMYVNPVGYSIPSHQIDISQNKSDLLLLVGCINGEQENNDQLAVIEDTEFRNSGCTYYVNEDQLSGNIDVIVLTNGNVLDVSLTNNSGIIANIDPKIIQYYNIIDDDIPMFYENNNPQANQWYQQYPNLSTKPLYTYIGNYLNTKSFTYATNNRGFDTITYDGNDVTSISIINGGILYTENNDYSKKDNLVAVKIKVGLSDLTYAGTASRVKIVSAVYDSTGTNGVSSDYPECKVIYIEFRLNEEGASIDGDDELNFDEQGTINGDHDVVTSITSTIPWTLGEQNTGSNE